MVGACQKSIFSMPPLPRPALAPAGAAAAVGARVGAGAAGAVVGLAAAAGAVVAWAAAGAVVGAAAGGADVGAGAAAGPHAAARSSAQAERTYRGRLITMDPSRSETIVRGTPGIVNER